MWQSLFDRFTKSKHDAQQAVAADAFGAGMRCVSCLHFALVGVASLARVGVG